MCSDDGYIISWDGNSLRGNSENLYRKRFTERKARTKAEILLDDEWKERRCVWCGVVRCGVVWCGVVWCGVVRCGVV